MHEIYQDPRNPRTGESLFPGFERGSEALLPIQASGTGPVPAVASYFRDLVFNDPNWDFRTFDYDKDVTRALRAHGDILDVPPKGLDRYLASGRKLLLSHGWADPLVPAMASVKFYNELSAKKATSARLFLIPGMGHCEGGDGPFVFDALATIDEWAETGRAPEHIIVRNPSNAPARTGLLCAFPNVATRSGSRCAARNAQ